jgi:hypothetical protein
LDHDELRWRGFSTDELRIIQAALQYFYDRISVKAGELYKSVSAELARRKPSA